MGTIVVKRTTNCIAFWTTASAVIIMYILVWFLFYPLVEYNNITGTFLFLGFAFAALFGLEWRCIGLGPERLCEALLVFIDRNELRHSHLLGTGIHQRRSARVTKPLQLVCFGFELDTVRIK